MRVSRFAIAARVGVATSALVVANATVASAGQDDPAVGHPRTGAVTVSEPVAVDGAGVRGRALQAAAGDPHLDTTWSGDGIAGLTGNRYTVALSPQDTGRLYTASFNQSDAGAMRITRFEANGTLGTSFGGGDGVLQRRFAPSTNAISFPSDIIRTGSKFVVVGDHYDGVRERLGIARMSTTGAYDNTFSGDGRVLYRIFPREHDLLNAWKVQVLNGGKIAIALVAFDLGAGDDYEFAEQAFVRLNANGTLDTTFHSDGIAIVSDDTSDVTWAADGSTFAGRPVLGGHEIRRLTPAGTLDTSFSGDGRATVPCDVPDWLGYPRLQVNPAGQPLLICGDELADELELTRLTTTGDPDLTYSDDGNATLDATGGDLEVAWGLVTTPSGAVWLSTRSVSDTSILNVHSIDENGDPNAGWGTGVSHTDFSFAVDINRMAIGGGRTWVALQKSATVTALTALVPGV